MTKDELNAKIAVLTAEIAECKEAIKIIDDSIENNTFVSTDKMREAFEDWFLSGSSAKLARAGDGYQLMGAQAAWGAWRDSWQAAYEWQRLGRYAGLDEGNFKWPLNNTPRPELGNTQNKAI